MKHVVATLLALSLLNSPAAFAQGAGHGPRDQSYGQGRPNDNGSLTNGPRWSRGDRVSDDRRQELSVVTDWRQHGLPSPPRGYQWVRNRDNDFFLIAITSGYVSQVLNRDDRDQRWRQRYSRTYTYNDDNYYQQCRNTSDPAGVIAGGLIGALLGRAMGNEGSRTGSTIAGVIFGAAVGAALTNKLDCDDRSYAYKTYYSGFNAGRANTTYQWRNPGNDHRGQFRVGSYYNDPAGFRCANYTQTIYIGGRAQQGKGRACRQGDGSWVIVN